MNILKSIWNWLTSTLRTLLDTVLDAVIKKAKDIAKDKKNAALALDAVKAAAHEGLTGEKAWVVARDKFTAALKDAGETLTDTAIDTTLQLVYAAWKDLGKPEA